MHTMKKDAKVNWHRYIRN